MSSVKIEGNANGTGIFTIASPNSNTNRTLTLPDVTGTFNTSGGVNEVPAGSASAPSIFFTSDSNTGMWSPAADTVAWTTAGSERARITSGGQVFVNRTARQTGSYDVQGAIYCDGIVSNYGLCSHSGRDGAYQTNAVNFQWTGSATRLWIDASDTGSITVSSDYRVKKNIQTQAQPALNRIAQIRPVTYTYADYEPFSWKADGIAREGFIAHELAEVIPSAVDGEKDEPNKVQSLKLDALCSVMVKAIQELKAELDATKAEVAALKGQA